MGNIPERRHADFEISRENQGVCIGLGISGLAPVQWKTEPSAAVRLSPFQLTILQRPFLG